MPSTNGHVRKLAIPYARVSTEEQARSGYSLAQQLEACRAWCATEGYEILEEVTDPGQSGASLERPGMDRVRDLVARVGGDEAVELVVVAQDRDRFAREPAYHYLLRKEFEEYGTRLKALNDRGDDSPEGELTDGILDQLAKYERAKIAERSRRGILRKLREGKLIAASAPNFGFKFNDARDNYVVDEEEMALVRRIFYMVGVEGQTLTGTANALRREGVPTPKGDGLWSNTVIRRFIQQDVYKAHSYDEVTAVVTPEAAAKLDQNRCYGLWWFNKTHNVSRQVAESMPDGLRYRKRKKVTPKPESEQIAVPVPASGIPREWVDAARANIRDNRQTSSNGGRFWELSGGVAWCELCGGRMQTGVVPKKNGRQHLYYRCWRRTRYGGDGCPRSAHHKAWEVEAKVWEYVRNLMQDPEHLAEGLNAMIEARRVELRGDPDKEARVWANKLAEVDQKRARFQDMAAEGLIGFDELREKLAALEETRQTTQTELAALSRRREEIEELERDRDSLLASYAEMVPERLDRLTPEQRHGLYKRLRLRVHLHPDYEPEITWAFGMGPSVSKDEPIPTGLSAAVRRICSR